MAGHFDPAEKRDSKGRWTRLAGLLRDSGGFTHSLATGDATSGVAVASHGSEKVIAGHASAADIKRYVAQHGAALKAPGAHLGGWFNPEEGKTYLDVSTVHTNLADAVKTAEANHQIAVQDLGDNKTIHTLAEDWQPNLDSMRGKDLKGLPSEPTNVPGHGMFTFHSNAELQGIANDYNKAHGLGKHPTDYSPVDPVRAAKVAAAFETMKNEPGSPKVAAAYAALKKETLAQYKLLSEHGYSYDFYPKDHDPYAHSPREAIYDLTKHHHMYVYPTLGEGGGFGDGEIGDNPLLEVVPGVKWGGKPVTYNDVFRAVHDTFGHAKEGVGFRGRGEDNAYRQHASMFTPLARGALASETRGQNSWLNYGPHGATNRTASLSDTIFADQKAGILPPWAIDPDLHKRSGTMSKKKGKGLSLAFQTPTLHNAEFDLAASSNGQLAFWKQILPMKAIHYTAKDGTRQVIDFTKDYLAGLATNTAVDSLGFLLADAGNKHTMDPERWRGKIAKLEVREDGTDPEASGLWGKVVFPSQEAAKAVLDNPELGVSARIRPNVQRSDGSTVPAGLIHVLGTLDPQVSGMKPWQATDLSNDEDEILDLSEEEYDEMPKSTEGQKAIEDMTEEDLKAMTEAELDAFLLAAGLDPADFADLEDEVAEGDEPEVDQNGAKRELVGAELSTTGNKDIDLARQEAADARAETRGLARRVAEAEWKATRDEYVAAGVPPHALDLAAPVLNRTDDMVIDLSSLGDEDVNVSEAVRGLLDALKGTVDLSTEEGHFGLHSGDDNPDTAILARWTPGE